MGLRDLVRAVLHPRFTRAAKATIRFLLIVGGLVAFAISFEEQMRHELPSAWTAMGLLLLTLAALFYDPENPPNQTQWPADEETYGRRHDDDSA